MNDMRQGERAWRRSTRCADAACVEVMDAGDGRVLVRSSLRPEAVLRLTIDEWSVFVGGVKDGDFDD